MNSRNLAAKALELFPDSDRVRTAFRAASIDLPPLFTILKRGGRAIAGFPVPGDQAIPMWERLRAVMETTGFYPLVIRDEFGWIDHAENTPGIVEDTLRHADQLDLDAWFKTRREEVIRDEQGFPRSSRAQGSPATSYHVVSDFMRHKPHTDLFMLLIPTTAGSSVPAHIQFGGWNECPDPAIQVALLRKWFHDHGAEPVTCSGDVLELRATRPPATQLDAMRLAEEQYLYCTDIVLQGVESIDALAHTLRVSTVWFFWWD